MRSGHVGGCIAVLHLLRANALTDYNRPMHNLTRVHGSGLHSRHLHHLLLLLLLHRC